MKTLIFIFVCALALFSCNNEPKSAFTGTIENNTAPVGTVPEESIYNISDTFTTQNKREIVLKDFAGKPVVLGMIFTHCTYACPRLTADIQNIEKELGPNAKNVNFILVSFDTERDTPAQLEKFKKEMNLDDRFTLLHGSEDAVRTLSVLLNIQFQKNSNGDFSHSNIISVLDKKGNLAYQKEGIQADQKETIKKLSALTMQ